MIPHLIFCNTCNGYRAWQIIHLCALLTKKKKRTLLLNSWPGWWRNYRQATVSADSLSACMTREGRLFQLSSQSSISNVLLVLCSHIRRKYTHRPTFTGLLSGVSHGRSHDQTGKLCLVRCIPPSEKVTEEEQQQHKKKKKKKTHHSNSHTYHSWSEVIVLPWYLTCTAKTNVSACMLRE